MMNVKKACVRLAACRRLFLNATGVVQEEKSRKRARTLSQSRLVRRLLGKKLASLVMFWPARLEASLALLYMKTNLLEYTNINQTLLNLITAPLQ